MPYCRLYLVFVICLLCAPSLKAQEQYAFDPFDRDLRPQPSLILTPQNALPSIPQERTKETLTEQDQKPSRIEAYYAGRIIDELEQFGYNLFYNDQNAVQSLAPAGAVQDDFILNVGDNLNIILRGQINSQKIYPITNDGLLTIDNLAPVPAAGRSLSQLTAALKNQLVSMPNIDLYVSLDKVRQIDVLVIGHVKKPGKQNLTVFNTLLDALSSASGITKEGSLRSIKLVRAGRAQLVDLYSLLIHASDIADLQLRDGDRIIVPPLGPTIAISGAVKRPGIYELRKTLRGMHHQPAHASENLNLEEILALSGGVLAPGQNRFMHLSLTQNGYEDVIDVEEAFKPQFRNGSILMVSPTDDARAGQVELTGHTRKEGIHPLSRHKTLSSLIDHSSLKDDVYPLIGIIERYDEQNLKESYIAFPLNLLIKEQFDQRLQSGDTIHLFSKTQIHNLDTKISPDTLIPASYRDQGSSVENLSSENYISDAVISQILREHFVHLKGAVRLPGAYPVTEGATLSDILDISGGLTLEANRNRIEVTSNQFGENGQSYGRSGTQRMLVNLSFSTPSTVSLVPGDSVRVNQTIRKLKNDTVLIAGEITQPGEYNLKPGDTLSILLARAGGLTPEAYPEGAIFSREQERKAEEQRYRATANEIERSLATALNKDERERPNEAQVMMVKDLAAELRGVKAVGRITVEASPDRLLSNPELDILLEPGDRIHMPKRPYNVRVRGEVLSPANLQFKTGKSPRDYLMEAGSFTHYADKERTFVIYPDGSAQPLQVSNWNYKPVMIPPGSTIIVPRDPKPFSFMETAKDLSQILGNLAVTAVVVDDIQDD